MQAAPLEPAAAQRRARPLLGTLVEISLAADAPAAWFELGFATIATVQADLSRFESDSLIARFNAAAAGTALAVPTPSLRLLWAARALQRASLGLFDISQGSGQGPDRGWQLREGHLLKLQAQTRLDLGGIAKGWAVDRALGALRQAGAAWACVNAGGDLRVSGPRSVSLRLRDERSGGVREFGLLEQGAFATSHFAPGSRSHLSGDRAASSVCHVSVAAPRCLWADALTKIVAASGDTAHPLLARLGAQAWLH
ncbi:FAD:protein FMN transferase [Paucibacter sp. AS339]|uniref:FAD:protein FMN transferase n=1 Tax=Paucibacter hankyongi TaxID=3133434 RepID=UPI0030A8E735